MNISRVTGNFTLEENEVPGNQRTDLHPLLGEILQVELLPHPSPVPGPRFLLLLDQITLALHQAEEPDPEYFIRLSR